MAFADWSFRSRVPTVFSYHIIILAKLSASLASHAALALAIARATAAMKCRRASGNGSLRGW